MIKLGIVGQIFALATLFFASSISYASGPFDRLEEIRKKVQETKASLEVLNKKQAETQRLLKSVREELSRLERKEKLSSEELQKTEKLAKEISESEQEARGSISELSMLSMLRLRSFYMFSDARRVSSLMLKRAHLSNFSRELYFIKRIKDFDTKVLSDLNNLKILLKNREAQAAQAAFQVKNLHQEIQKRRREQGKRVAEQETLLRHYNGRRTEIESSLALLKAQALRLETVVRSIMTSQASQNGSQGIESSSNSLSSHQQGSFDGSGLDAQKKILSRPVNGKVVRDFGKPVSQGFKDIVRSRGVEFLAPDGDYIHAIAPGKVIYQGNMPGYGNVVILDHGKRTYSLYGRMGEVFVTKGDEIPASRGIGRVANKKQGALGNFYFEIRKNASPVDPRDYFGNSF